MDDAFAAGADFIARQARLLDRRVFATLFDDAAPKGVIEALRGYRNDDGGFGHGLEPDTLCPASLPIDVEVALEAMVVAGARDEALALDACEWLARAADVAGAGGAVPLAYPVIESFPRAAHWGEWTYEPGLNPTAGLVGRLLALGVDHRFVAEGARYCWQQIDGGDITAEAHVLAEVLYFLEHSPVRARADAAATGLVERLASATWWLGDAAAAGYGLTPLHLAPLVTSRWRAMFPAEQIEAHLDRLVAQQQDDGGWPISWAPPSDAAALDWRGIETLRALRTLVSYGRMRPGG